MAAKSAIKQIELVDTETIKSLSFCNINGAVYFGKITIAEGTGALKIENAIEVTGGDTKSIVKEWLTANNKGTLRNPKVGGQIAYNIEDLNDAQVLEIEALIASLNSELKNVFVNLANDVIDAI